MLFKIICACLAIYVLHRCCVYLKCLWMVDSPAASARSQNSLKSSLKKRHSKRGKRIPETQLEVPKTKQTFDAFLVLDIEGTCDSGTNFDYPNEIIASHTVPKYISASSSAIPLGISCLSLAMEEHDIRQESRSAGNH